MAWDAETLGAHGTLGRQSYREVLLARHFKAALKALNPRMTAQRLRPDWTRRTS